MNNITEQIYNFIEAFLLTGFISLYFEPKNKCNSVKNFIISFIMIFGLETLVTVCKMQWVTVLLLSVFLLVLISETFYKGKLLEHLLIATIAVLLIAVIDVCVFTVFSRLFSENYSELVTNNTASRFLTVLITKVVYLIVVSVVISFKKKYTLMLHSMEYVMMSATLIVSGVLASLVRNIIYDTKSHYGTFLIVILCVLLLNIGQYYTMIYISKKISVKRICLLCRSKLKCRRTVFVILKKSMMKLQK